MTLHLPSFKSDDDVVSCNGTEDDELPEVDVPEVDVVEGEQAASVTAAASQETAGVWNVDKESMCPACGKPMRNVTAAGVPSFVCMDDRVVLPVRQPEFSTNQG